MKYDFDPNNGCPVCGVANEFNKSHDPERLEPDTEHCEFCGYFWEENAQDHHPSDAEIEDYRDELLDRCKWFKEHGEMITKHIQTLNDL